jgi:hypothetical protein
MQSDFVQVALPSSPTLIKKRQASEVQRQMIGHGSRYKSAWQNQPNALYPYKNAKPYNNLPIRDVLNAKPDDSEAQSTTMSTKEEEGEEMPQRRSESPAMPWSPTAAWSDSSLPTRNTGGCLSLSRSRSPYFERNMMVID